MILRNRLPVSITASVFFAALLLCVSSSAPAAGEIPTPNHAGPLAGYHGFRAVDSTVAAGDSFPLFPRPLVRQYTVAQADPDRKPDAEQPGKEEKADETLPLKLKIIELQNKGKLGFRTVVPCSLVEGFGVYSPIQPGQKFSKLIIYYEPANVSTMISQDRYVIDCSLDFFMTDPSGKVLLGKEKALTLNRVSRSPILDIFFKIEFNLKKPLSKSVILRTVLHDKIKNQSATSTFRINVEPGAKRLLDPI